MMYEVCFYDEATQDEEVVFEGTVEECQAYIEDCEDWEQEFMSIICPSGDYYEG